ncbi:MAG: cytochrome C [Phycisphaerales bacterium]|nr:cytochrome C [Phycisphaerales bacterium]
MKLKNALLTAVSMICALFAAQLAVAQDRVTQTVHNLSVSGPGSIHAADESQVCIFCHAPHHTSGVRPLWNREIPLASYTIYESSTLDAKPGQPTGASKLCLSCHDGTIALGNVLSRADRIRMVGGDFIPAGLSNLGTDLSDDHPVSLFYTSGLAASDRQLASPQTLPAEVHLDASGQLQCTSCHDPHQNLHGDFLVKSDEFGALCTACHRMDGWSGGSHQSSGTPMPSIPTVDWPYGTVGQNACRSCHRSHTAGGRERLLIFEDEEENCLDCHNGQAGANILAEIDKISAHDPRRYVGVHDPVEEFGGEQAHVECVDCHNPHAVSTQPPALSYIPIGATLAFVRGVTIGGTPTKEADAEYQVCLRCHGDAGVTVSQAIQRQAQTSNLRLKFSPGNPSFHPVVSSSPSPDTVSLVPGLANGSLIRCTDCHNSDSGPGAKGGGPAGPHGSIYDFLLERNYTVTDNVPESSFEYALCYKCHQQSIVLSGRSFNRHRLHVVNERIPCSACHDPHGISVTVGGTSDHTHLINFDTVLVLPEQTTGRLEFRDDGSFAGSCTLSCHGANHLDTAYHQGP